MRLFSRPKQPSIELALVTLIGVLYIGRFMTFDSQMTFAGLEHERLSGVLLPIKIGIEQYGRIPHWNPYLTFGGEPTLGNPFNYLFNPFMSVPVLSLGAVQGTKVALSIHLLVAGYGMWLLLRMMRVGSAGRVTAAGLYLMSGAIAAKFAELFGHFQLALSMAWIPFVLAGLWWTLHSRNRFAPVFMAFMFAMLFFAGNIYFTLHTVLSASVITVFYSIDRDKTWRLRFDRMTRVAVGAVFAFGLAMLQFWPIWVVRGSIGHTGDPALTTRYGFGQVVRNFIAKPDDWIADAINTASSVQLAVDYAYLGLPVFIIIFAGMVLLMFARYTHVDIAKRPFIIAGILIIIMTLWGMGETPLLRWLYANSNLLAQFRFVGRAMGIAALWWIVLAGLAIDVVWRSLDKVFTISPSFDRYDSRRLSRVGLVAVLIWAWFVVYSRQSNSTRFDMVLHNFAIFNWLAPYTIATLADATKRLWQILLMAIAIDTSIWMLGGQMRSYLQPRNYTVNRARLHTQLRRLLRIGVVAIAVSALINIADTNRTLFAFTTNENPFTALYDIIKAENDTTIFPIVAQPFSRFTYGTYQRQIRNWNLTEGWRPLPRRSPLLAGQARLLDIPRWATVWSGAYRLAQQFVDANGYSLRHCEALVAEARVIDACDPTAQATVLLYEHSDALPYAYIIDSETTNRRERITRGDVVAARVLSHELDRITIRVDAIPEKQPAYLIVQEVNFPGWRAFVGRSQTPLYTIGNAMAVELQPGEHLYTFAYRTPGLTLGVVSFVMTFVVIVWWLILDKRLPLLTQINRSD